MLASEQALSGSSDARVKAVFQLFAVQIAADEDEAAFALFAVFPGPLVITFDDHVYALHHIAFRVVLKRDDAFQAQNIGAIGLRHLLNPREEPFGIHFTAAQRDGLNRDIVDR